MSNYILQTRGLGFLDLLRYPDLSIEENKATFILGESGCGKSTLLRLFNATLLPSAGEIFYRGENIRQLEVLAYRKKVLLASQDVYLFDGSIRDNFNAYYQLREQAPIDEKTMSTFLSLCCLDFDLDTPCGRLSGGERQRVFLAICISFGFDVLLLDEPTSALDEKTARQLMTNLKEYISAQGKTLAAVSHSRELAEAFGDRIILLEKGAQP